MAELLAPEGQKELLKIAREAIVSYLSAGTMPQAEIATEELQGRNGCFVTIKQQGKLRGCIGNFVSDRPLYALVREMAVSAATRDPRFYPMKSTDLDDFELDIGVGAKLLVDPMSRSMLEGLTVDFVDSLTQTGFKFNNPNATGGCACGQSFSA